MACDIRKFMSKRKLPEVETGLREGTSSDSGSAFVIEKEPVVKKSATASKEFVDVSSIPADPAERKPISEYHPNQIDEIRRAYLLKGPCQPRSHDFPWRLIGKAGKRRFIPEWFDLHAKWLEYSIKEDKAYCLCCYLFKNDCGNGKKGSGGAFVSEGFCSWNKKERFDIHVGNNVVDSAHNVALRKCEDLMNQERSIDVSLNKHTNVQKQEYLVRLTTTIELCKVMSRQGMAFRGHDESEGSSNMGNFRELHKYTIGISEPGRKAILENAPKNNQMISPKIQKDVVHCFAKEIQQSILQEINGDFFSLLVDESSDVSGKEQMAVVFRFVDSHGQVKERFIGVTHVAETSSLILKSVIDELFAELGLSLMRIRGQGYDGASNISGRLNGLKTLIMKENESAFYVHCFCHQLQLALVGLARKHADVEGFFSMTSLVTTVVGGSCKRKDMIRQSQATKLAEFIDSGVIDTGTGLNQEVSLQRAGDTRWGSHHDSLLSLAFLYPDVVDVLRTVQSDRSDSVKQNQARGLLAYLESFNFVFYLQLMIKILMITNVLSVALQKKDEDIVNAMRYVKMAKTQLQDLRISGWEDLLDTIIAFCEKNDIDCLNMSDEYALTFSRRHKTNITNEFHYRVECFNEIVDMQLSEMNDRFTEINSELLLCIGSLSPFNNFAAFDVKRLMKMTSFYPKDFSPLECMAIKGQLDTYFLDVTTDDRFSKVIGLGNLSTLLVQTRKHVGYPLVYRLLRPMVFAIAGPKFCCNIGTYPRKPCWQNRKVAPARLQVFASLPEPNGMKVEYTPWLIVGLGNPGNKYHGTRHNVGFEMIDKISQVEGIVMDTIQSKALVGIGSMGEVPVLLVKPQAYMNFSGESVGPLAAYYRVPLRHILLVYDETSLPNGILRLRPKGGHGHHNGVKSVMEHLEDRQDFPRLCIGIGNPPGTMDLKAFYLQKFSAVERKQVDLALEQGAEAVRRVIMEGFNEGINRFNLSQKYKYHKI